MSTETVNISLANFMKKSKHRVSRTNKILLHFNQNDENKRIFVPVEAKAARKIIRRLT